MATDEAMISGLAPGREALIDIVGKSTCGKGETGRNRNATAPESAIATVKSVVAIGLLMKGAEKFIFRYLDPLDSGHLRASAARLGLRFSCASQPNVQRFRQRTNK